MLLSALKTKPKETIKHPNRENKEENKHEKPLLTPRKARWIDAQNSEYINQQIRELERICNVNNKEHNWEIPNKPQKIAQ